MRRYPIVSSTQMRINRFEMLWYRFYSHFTHSVRQRGLNFISVVDCSKSTQQTNMNVRVSEFFISISFLSVFFLFGSRFSFSNTEMKTIKRYTILYSIPICRDIIHVKNNLFACADNQVIIKTRIAERKRKMLTQSSRKSYRLILSYQWHIKEAKHEYEM